MSAEIELTLSGLHAFAGPMDLLLAIVRRNGYPLDRLPLGEITRQYIAYLEQHRAQRETAGFEQEDLELGAEFFETASWLVLLKSRALLPGAGREAAEELGQQLAAHAEITSERITQLTGFLAEQFETAGRVSGRAMAEGRAGEGQHSVAEDTATAHKAPTVQDAVVAARRALAASRAHASATAAAEAGLAMADVLQALDHRLALLAPGVIHSTALWFQETDRETGSMLLLALLELARLGTLWVYQAAPGTALWIQRPQVLRKATQESKQRSRSRQRQGAAR